MAVDLRAAARTVCRRATRRSSSVRALSRTRCRAGSARFAICRLACGPSKCSSPFHFADRGRASARYPSVPCRRAWRGFVLHSVFGIFLRKWRLIPALLPQEVQTPWRATVSSLKPFCTYRSNLGRLPALSRLLKHGLQWCTRSLISQLHVSSRQPHLVAASAGFTSGVETKLVLLDAPFADTLVTHGCDRKRAVTLEHLAPVRLVRQLHSGESCLNLRTRELLEFLSCGVWFEGNDTERHDHRRSHLLVRLHRGDRISTSGSSVRSSRCDLTHG